MELKDQSDEHNQTGANDFQSLIRKCWVCSLSPVWYDIDCSQLKLWCHCHQFQLVYQTVEYRPVRNIQHETLQTTFDMLVQLQHILYKLYKSLPVLFFVFQLLFYLSWNINNETKYAENIAFFFHLQYSNSTQKSTNLDFLKMHTDMTAVTI